MAVTNRAKEFEKRFKLDWIETVPDSFCYRLYDTTSGYLGVKNVSDFINYKDPHVYLIDCKVHEGNTLPFSAFSQYDMMVQYKDITGLKAGTMVWFVDHDKIVWIPIETWYNIKSEEKKSFNIKMIGDENYKCLVIPTKKLRTFLKGDYSHLINYYKEN